MPGDLPGRDLQRHRVLLHLPGGLRQLLRRLPLPDGHRDLRHLSPGLRLVLRDVLLPSAEMFAKVVHSHLASAPRYRHVIG